MFAILLAIYAFILISALLYIAANMYTKRDHQRRIAAREKYQEHIDDLVDELFPPTIQTPDVQTAIDQLQTSNEDLWRQEAKRNMVANIRTYFNQRKINAKMPGPDELAPVNPSAGSSALTGSYDDLTFPTPPSIQRFL